MEAGLLRIGELSRRTGVSPELLRAWERRYELLKPMRSTGGLRLYSSDDLERVTRMQQHLADGLAAAEAAALASARPAEMDGLAFDAAAVRHDLGAALESFDDAYARTDWSRFRGLPAFEQANRTNAYGTYLLMEQELLRGGKP